MTTLINPAPYLESTLLKVDCLKSDVLKLIDDAAKYSFKGVCILPKFIVPFFNYSLSVPLITVVGFPFGLECVDHLPDALYLANEVDMVMDVSAFLDKDYEKVLSEIRQVKRHIGKTLLKVIMETTKLDEKQLVEVVRLLTDSDCDILKTNTGIWKERKRSLEEDIKIIRANTSKPIKAAGGIETYSQVQRLIELGADRIGTSNAMRIMKEYKEEAGKNI